MRATLNSKINNDPNEATAGSIAELGHYLFFLISAFAIANSLIMI